MHHRQARLQQRVEVLLILRAGEAATRGTLGQGVGGGRSRVGGRWGVPCALHLYAEGAAGRVRDGLAHERHEEVGLVQAVVVASEQLLSVARQDLEHRHRSAAQSLWRRPHTHMGGCLSCLLPQCIAPPRGAAICL